MQEKRLALFEQISLKYFESMLNQHTTEEVPVSRWTQFSWSTSRHHVFERCKREYYLNYYGARNVKEANNAAVSAVWWLKRITSLKAWIGTTIHELAAKILVEFKSGREINETGYARLAQEYYLRGVEASREGKKFFSPLNRDDQGDHIILEGHVYDLPHFDNDLEMGFERTGQLMEIFFNSQAYQMITSLPTQTLYEIDPPFQSFMMDGIPEIGSCSIFAIPDVLIHDGTQITIIDWKTGDPKKEGIGLQAGVYRLYAATKYKLPEERVSVVVSALGLDGGSILPLGGLPSIAETDERIKGSIAEMTQVMQSIKHNTAAIKNFPMTDDLSLCEECTFRRACWRENKTSGQMTLF